MDTFTNGALWDYWKLGSDEIEPTNEKTFNLEETNQDDEQEIDEISRIETNLFDYETSLCEKFKEFNYLIKIDPDVLTNDIMGFNTYDKYRDDWIYEWNKNVPWSGLPVAGEKMNIVLEETYHELTYDWEYENEHEDDERYELCGNETHDLSVCTVRRFEMIKYSFGQNQEYVVVKEDEYEDLTSTSKIHAKRTKKYFA
uniref:Uncharacterized protein n=1 Tax=Tanacetum cinerariifolium TaxID=118510 RepID=A0A699J975_TANCI|nr:hypothetical protein [Tanacetum cinerariifolium]